MLDNPDLPSRTRPYLRKLLRGLCRFYAGYGSNGNPCIDFDTELSADMATRDGQSLVEKLIALAIACAEDFDHTAHRHGLPRFDQYHRAASKLRLVAESLRAQQEADPTDAQSKPHLDTHDVAFCTQYVVREIVNAFPVDEFEKFAITDDSEGEAAA